MTTKTKKQTSKKTTLHAATPGKSTPVCGGKGMTTTADLATCAECLTVVAHAAEKARNEGRAAPASATKATGKLPTGAPAKRSPRVAKPLAPTAPERDPRLPPVGTVLRKLDRAGATRCELKLTETGFVYAGQEFRSLSAAAMAAAKDLGVASQVNGWVWWGLVRSARLDPVEALDRAWTRYREHVRALAGGTLEGAVKSRITTALGAQGREILEVAGAL